MASAASVAQLTRGGMNDGPAGHQRFLLDIEEPWPRDPPIRVQIVPGRGLSSASKGRNRQGAAHDHSRWPPTLRLVSMFG